MDKQSREILQRATADHPNEEAKLNCTELAKWEIQKSAERSILVCDPEDTEQPVPVDQYRIMEIEGRLRDDEELQLNEEDFDFLIPAKPEAVVRHRLAGYYSEFRLRTRELDIAQQKMLDDRVEVLTVTELKEKEYNRIPDIKPKPPRPLKR